MLRIIFFLSFIVCAQACTAQIPEINRYEAALVELSSLYDNGDFDALKIALEKAKYINAIAVPRYELTFYEAVIQLENGKRISGEALLSNFIAMTLIDSGQLNCSIEEIAVLVGPVNAKVVEKVMCAEYYLAYYAQPTIDTFNRIAGFWYEVELAKRRYQ